MIQWLYRVQSFGCFFLFIAAIASVVNAISCDETLMDKWEDLGIELGLDYTDIKMIHRQFRQEEHIQRMVEKWFDQEDVCTWETFTTAKSRVLRLQSLEISRHHSPTTHDTESGKLLQ